MPLLSILTPTQAHNAQHLPEVGASILAQVLPAGWEWEWLVQEDGEDPSLAGIADLDPRVVHDALGRQLGGPTTRNVALARARGDVVATIDHDDRYLDGGLAALLAPLAEDAQVGWSCGACRLEMDDGGTWMREPVFDEGAVPQRAVTDHFLAHDDWPFPAGFALYRRTELVALGGWPAVPRSGDASLLAAYSDRWPGWWVARTVAVYRRWPAQRSVQPQDFAIRDLPHVRGMIGQRRAAEDALAARQRAAEDALAARQPAAPAPNPRHQ